MNKLVRTVAICLTCLGLLVSACGGRGVGQPSDAGDGYSQLDDVHVDDLFPGETIIVNLAPLLRLTGTDPVLQPPMPWPREAEDGVATVRDDWPSSSWKAPAGFSQLVLDLVPWAGGPVPLEAISLVMDGEGPDLLAVYTAAACTSARIGPEMWPDTGEPFHFTGRHVGCLWLEAESEEPFNVTGLELLARNSGPPVVVPPGTNVIKHPSSGVVEGFYGVPWSWRERTAMVSHMANLGLGVYIHAPKSDPLHRAQWRESYPASEMEQFGLLAGYGEILGVTVMAGLSPFVDWGPDEETDYALLVDKLEGFLAAGIRGFVLLADDIEFEIEASVDGSMGQAHVTIANQLLADLRDSDGTTQLWFVPTVYSDDRADQWPGGLDYLAALAELHPDIEIMWTGPGTSNATLVAADFDRFVALVGRTPVLWENYWANDGGDAFVGRLPLASYAGREPAVVDVLGGIVANPLIQGGLARLALTSAAGFLEQPQGCPAPESRAAAAAAELPFTGGAAAAPAIDGMLLEFVQELFDADTLGSPGWPRMEVAVAALSGKLSSVDSLPIAETADLLPLFASMITLGSEMHSSGLDADLVDELYYPLLKVSLEGKAGLYGLLALGDRLAGKADSTHWAKAKAAQEQSMICRFMFSYGCLDSLLADIAAIDAIDLDFILPECKEPIPNCISGVELTWLPCASCTELRVFGLPGHQLDGDLVRWTPALPGSYNVVSTCVTAKGWTAQVTVVDCKPETHE
jgi:hypothetical protein